MSATAVSVRARPTIAVPTLAVPATLFVLALVARILPTTFIHFPLSEGSAYYVAVARNIVEGRGLVVDAIWSYATPPLTLPRPAFELWQPIASSLAALPMYVFGPTYSAAQLGFAVVGALVAPLTWLIARDAAARLDLPAHRRAYVAAGAGAIAALAGPFVLSAAIPDSTLPFTVLAVGACLAMPKAARGERRAIVALGLLLALAYLTRMEAVYLGVVFVALCWTVGVRGGLLVGRVGAVAAVGALIALPWWLRNLSVFGTPAPGQLADNAFLTTNEQIFSFATRPTLDGFVAQGPATILVHIGQGLWHDTVDVLLVPGNVVVALALLTLALGWRRWRAVSASPLAALLSYGTIAFLVTGVVFPVATQWGTFEHAAGPLLIAFVVLAVLGGDAFVARVRAWRRWPRPNAGMAPAAIAAVVVTMTVAQLLFASAQAAARGRQMDAVAAAVRDAGIADGSPLVSDHPLWLSDALGTPAVVMPYDAVASLESVARTFGARYVVLSDGLAGGSAAALVSGCLSPLTVTAPVVPGLRVYSIEEACR